MGTVTITYNEAFYWLLSASKQDIETSKWITRCLEPKTIQTFNKIFFFEFLVKKSKISLLENYVTELPKKANACNISAHLLMYNPFRMILTWCSLTNDSFSQ